MITSLTSAPSYVGRSRRRARWVRGFMQDEHRKHPAHSTYENTIRLAMCGARIVDGAFRRLRRAYPSPGRRRQYPNCRACNPKALTVDDLADTILSVSYHGRRAEPRSARICQRRSEAIMLCWLKVTFT